MQWPKLVVIVGVFLFLFTYRWTHLHIVHSFQCHILKGGVVLSESVHIMSYQVVNIIPDRSKYLYFLKMYI